MAIHYCTGSIGCFLLAVGFLVYGNQLVGIAKEGLHVNGSEPGLTAEILWLSQVRIMFAAKYVAANYTIIKKTAVVPGILLLNTICIKYYVN